MGFLGKIGGFVSKGIGAATKLTSWVGKAATNPIGAASDALQGGFASLKGVAKSPTAVKIDNSSDTSKTSQPSSSRSAQMSSSSSSGGGIMGWLKGTWRIFGTDVQRWVVLLIVFIIIVGAFMWMKRKAKRAIGRRRTFAARRARVAKRRIRRK
jgi:hypothetical protein